MQQKYLVFGILGLFLAIQIIGLYTSYQYTSFLVQNPQYEMFTNAQDTLNSFYLFGMIIVGTALLIVIIKFWRNALKYLEFLVIVFASDIALEALIPIVFYGIPLGLVLAVALAVWKFKWPNIINQNTALIFSISGAGALIGVSLNVLPIMIFAAVLSIYDVVSVFFTKHMVYMARALTEKPMAFVAAIPTTFEKAIKIHDIKTGKTILKKAHTFQLGGGDLAVPLMISASVLRYFSLERAVFTAVGALVATFFIFWYVTRKPGRPLPALPPIVAGSFLGFAVSFLIL